MSIRVCFVVNEYPGWGMRGGFGYVTKEIAEGIASTRKAEVFVITTRHQIEKEVKIIEERNNVIVIHVPKSKILKFIQREFFKIVEPDVFHHQDVNTDSFFIWKLNKHTPHIITFQDPAPFEEILRVKESEEKKKISEVEKVLLKIKYELYRKIFIFPVVKNAEKVFSQVKDIIPFVKSYYKLKEVNFLPNPVKIPKGRIKKADEPTVLFLGRLDVEKRPHLVIKIARRFPEVKFVLAGLPSRNYRYGRKVIELARKQKNVTAVGWIEGKEKDWYLRKSWILINTSVKERLPYSFLEAMAYGVALLAYVNPDRLVEKFGYWAKFEDFGRGLQMLLSEDSWRVKGKKAKRVILREYEYDKVINKHIKIYNSLVA